MICVQYNYISLGSGSGSVFFSSAGSGSVEYGPGSATLAGAALFYVHLDPTINCDADQRKTFVKYVVFSLNSDPDL